MHKGATSSDQVPDSSTQVTVRMPTMDYVLPTKQCGGDVAVRYFQKRAVQRLQHSHLHNCFTSWVGPPRRTNGFATVRVQQAREGRNGGPLRTGIAAGG